MGLVMKEKKLRISSQISRDVMVDVFCAFVETVRVHIAIISKHSYLFVVLEVHSGVVGQENNYILKMKISLAEKS